MPFFRGRAVRVIGYVLGVALLGAAVWVVVAHRDTAAQGIDALADAAWWKVALLLASPGLNWLISTLIFWVLLNRYGVVGRREMAALMAASWLLNHLPMRAGLIGRLAYHRLVNDISAVKVGRSVLDSIVCSVISLGVSLLVVLTFIGRNTAFADWANVIIITIIGVVGLVIAAIMCRSAHGAAGEHSASLWRYICGTSLRILDGVVWAGRYWLVFSLLNTPIPPSSAMAIAVVSQTAGLLPVPVGLREWAVGVTSSALPGSKRASADGKDTSGVLLLVSGGVLADIVLRVTELAWALPTGAISVWWLWRRYQRRRSNLGPATDTTHEGVR